MASSFPDSFDQLPGDSTRSFDSDGYFGYDPRLASQFDSFSNFSDSESVKQSSTSFPPAVHVSGGEFPADLAPFSSEDGEGGFSGAVLPPPAEMEPEDGVALKEWRRKNLIRLAEKEKREKESLSQILGEAEQYKVEFYKKRSVSCEANKGNNREKEKLFVVSHEKFHAEADKTYWKAIEELIPKEVATVEKKRGKKEQDKDKPSIAVMQGPKPGKPTDLSRMRHILLKLKHNAPPHLVHAPPSSAVGPTAGDSAASASPLPPTNAAAVATTHVEAVAVA